MSLKEVKSELSKTQGESKMKLSKEEERDLISKYGRSRKITYQQLKTQMAKEKSKFPQPVRTQPTMEVFTSKDSDYTIAQRIVKLTAKDVKSWGKNIIADVKYDGIRAMIVIDPKKKEVRVLSRSLATLKKFEKKYNDLILKNITKIVKDKSVMDAELYALGPNGEILPGPTVTGWAKNPTAEKYNQIQPSIEVFDVMVLNSKDVRKLPLKYRKRLLEIALRKDDDRILDVADTRMMQNSSRLIDWLFQGKVNKRGFEGLVLKDPESEYFYSKPTNNPWKKVKAVDTLDLRLKAVSAYPEGKVFNFYKHWEMTPSDADMTVKADKGIQEAEFDYNFYINFTKGIINKWKSGRYEADGPMVQVASDLIDVYGVKEVPKRIKMKKGPIIELFVEKMSDNLQPSGTKIVRIRDDKKEADKVEDMVRLRDYLLGVNTK
jgi:ATP-dependent DNA ligase